MNNANHITSITEGLEIIKKALAEHGPTAPLPHPTHLDRSKIARMSAVFTARSLEYRVVGEEVHLSELTGAIGNAKHPRYLDPLTVWWGGDRYYVIDGHMRLEAYRRKSVTNGIPVVIFEGTLDEAMAQSAALNSKNQLPMTREDRMNFAWRLTLVSDLSKEKILRACGVGNGSVGNMRKAKQVLEETGRSLEDLCGMPWDDARKEAEGQEIKKAIDMDAAREKQAERMAIVIARATGDRPFKDPDLFASAIARMGRGLPKLLIQSPEWEEPVREHVSDLMEAFDAEDLVEAWEEEDRIYAERQAEWDANPDY